MSSVSRQPISALQVGAQNALIIGVIINSMNMKTFDASRMKFRCGERGVWTFTLRDPEEDSINVTVWGSVEFVKDLTRKFHIGSIVEVINPKVMERNIEDKGEMFVPSVSSPCSLTVNEGKSLVQVHDGPTREEYKCLLMRPIKNLERLQSLKSVLEHLEELRDQYIDVLLVVTFVSDLRNIVTRDGREMKCRNFEATDGSTDEVASLMLWENEWIERAAAWEPKRTVLLLTDLRISYDNFKKKITPSIARKTLITENPDIPEAHSTQSAVQQYDADTLSDNPFTVPNPDTITNTMTINEISTKLNKKVKQGERIQFATILRAFVVDLNLDSTSADIIATRCAQCKRLVADNKDSCMNLECPSGNGTRIPINLVGLNLKVNLKDATGYLIGCKLTGQVAEQALGCTVKDFQAMSLPQRSDLKWKLMLQKFETRIHVLGPTTVFPSTAYNILSISPIETEEHGVDPNGNFDIGLS